MKKMWKFYFTKVFLKIYLMFAIIIPTVIYSNVRAWKTSADNFLDPIWWCLVVNKRVLIVKGEVRKIKHKSSDGYYILHGLDENGNFGWVEPNDIQLMETRKWVEEN